MVSAPSSIIPVELLLFLAATSLNLVSSGPLHTFSCGRLFYRTFHMDAQTNSLFVGAMNHMFKLSLENINASSCHTPKFEPDFRRRCESIGKSRNYHCQNHIKVIQPLAKGQYLYICGTNAFRPKDWIVHSGNLSEVTSGLTFPGVGDGIAKCPFDPDDNSTAVWVDNGNPGNFPALYSGTVADISRTDHLIFRSDLYDSRSTIAHPYLRTIEYDTKWLNGPDFVGSFEIGDLVYFFYRENAIEQMNVGKHVVSRVARVCKKDTGGRNVLEQNWSTYLKARLNCSLPAEYPFYFDHIQSVVKADTPRTSTTTFYATFTTSSNSDAETLQASAVCAFNLDDIERTFNGRFKEQTTVDSAWLPVLNSDVPEPRPGRCVENTKTLPDNVLTFIKTHSLMDSAVAHQHGKPLFYQHGVLFTKLSIVQTIAEGYEYTVIFAGTNKGIVHKILHWYDSVKHEVISRLVDTWDDLGGEAVRSMTTSPDHRSLYVGSDAQIVQYSVSGCKNYAGCGQCVRDPFCVWNKQGQLCQDITDISESLKWRPDPNFLQDVREERHLVCDESVVPTNISTMIGQTAFLSCPANPHASSQELQWFHNKTRISPSSRLHRTEEGLVMTDVKPSDAGDYDVYSGHQILCRFRVSVDQGGCQVPRSESDYKKVYQEWCDEFQKYKKQMQVWEKSKQACLKHHTQHHINAIA